MTRPLALVSFAVFLLSFGLSSGLSSRLAAAKPKVAVTQIDGDASGEVRDAVTAALEGGGGELSLIGNREVNRAVDKLGDLWALNDSDFKKLATELEADAIVLGKLDRSGAARTLKFRLFIYKKPAKGFTVSFKNARSEKFRAMLHAKVVDKIATTPNEEAEKAEAKKKADQDAAIAAAAKDAVAKELAAKEAAAKEAAAKEAAAKETAQPVKPREEPPAPAKDSVAEAKAESDESDEGAPRKATRQVAAAGAEPADAGVAVRVDGARAGNRAAARLDVGASMVQRSFAFNAAENANKPRDSTLAAVAGLRIEAELYPLALTGSERRLANLGLAGEYDRSFGLTVGAMKAAVTQQSFSIGLRYRHAFGTTPTSATLTVGVGYGQRQFAPAAVGDPAVARDTPSTTYAVIDPGLRFRLPLTRMFALSLAGRGLVIAEAGPIQDPTSYGQATVFGGEAVAALDVMLGRRFALRLAGEFVQIGFSFAGNGALSNNVDGNTASRDVSGLTDRSIGGSATLAVVY